MKHLVVDTFKSRPDPTQRPIVFKLGGEVISSPEISLIAEDISACAADGSPVVVVHGGGAQVTNLQKRLGQEPKQIGGRRVTDAEALDVVKMVIAGKLNVDLCSALIAANAHPLGLHGASGHVIKAVKRPPRVYSGAGPDPIDLGLVGDVLSVDKQLLDLLLSRFYVPVIACLGADSGGTIFNINADIVANKVAAELKAEGLVLISDVRGVLRDVSNPSSRIPTLTVAQGRSLIASGTVTKGMVVKLEESFEAINAGVRRVHIIGRVERGDLVREARSPGSVGTAILP